VRTSPARVIFKFQETGVCPNPQPEKVAPTPKLKRATSRGKHITSQVESRVQGQTGATAKRETEKAPTAKNGRQKKGP